MLVSDNPWTLIFRILEVTFICVIRLFVTVRKPYLHQSTKGQIKSLRVSTLRCPFLSPLKTNIYILCIFELGISFLQDQISNVLVFLILMSMFMSPSCLFMFKMWVSWYGQPHPRFRNGSYWYVPLGWSYRPCYLSAASAELAWVGQEGFIDFVKGLN